MFSSIEIFNLPVENSISTLSLTSPFCFAAKAVAQAAVPQALVSPAPLSHTLTFINSLFTTVAKVTLHFSGNREWVSIFGPIFSISKISLLSTKKERLNATLISGVNGVGKTTTIGKISKILKGNGNKVMLAASDTFRAAAIEQLESWAKKVDVQITKSSQGSDPASVAYKAIEEALNNDFNQVLIDTAGRLQNKKNLMEEYKKIANVTKKIDPDAPHDVILVLDATSGQNVINQVEEFNKIIPITGLIMTKLDGTAKGGILLAVAKKYKIPIIALGLGEKEDDLQIFEAEKFAEAFTQIN